MGWTNAAVQEMFNKYGDRICVISLNNGKKMYIDYNLKEGVRRSDISFETVGGVDVMKVTHRSSKQTDYIEWENFITTEFIEEIGVMKEGYEDYRVDPLLMHG